MLRNYVYKNVIINHQPPFSYIWRCRALVVPYCRCILWRCRHVRSVVQKCCQLLLHIVASQSASKDQVSTAVMPNNAGTSAAGQRRQLQLIHCTDYNVLSYVVNLLITCLQVPSHCSVFTFQIIFILCYCRPYSLHSLRHLVLLRLKADLIDRPVLQRSEGWVDPTQNTL